MNKSADLEHITCVYIVSLTNVGEDLLVLQWDISVKWSNMSYISQSGIKGHLRCHCCREKEGNIVVILLKLKA